MNSKRIGIIGLGLIGGSIARAIRRCFPSSEILAYDTDRDSLSLAMADGIIDYACTKIDEHYGTCDYIFLCTPVSYNSGYLSSLKEILRPGCILTDVGSVKTDIHLKIIELGLEANFIGGHPMAGSEKTGFSNSTAHLVENAYYVLTPSAKVPDEAVQRMREMVAAIGAIPIILGYQEHDYITASVSHLPHIIAASLVNLIKVSDSEDGLMKTIAAGGFKDITRIASSSPVMWQQICLTNGENISRILGDYIDYLGAIRQALDSGNQSELYDLFYTAREYRNSIPNASLGPIKKVFAVYCDIIDEAGGIATIATILASNNISIKNIGIIHNREFEEGVLRIEFYEEDPSLKAVELLRKYRYTVYER